VGCQSVRIEIANNRQLSAHKPVLLCELTKLDMS